MAEGARLESVYTATYRGFESLSLRQFTALEFFGRHFLNSQTTLRTPVLFFAMAFWKSTKNHLRLLQVACLSLIHY